ncbi:MAG: hypothetical protein ACHQU0_01850 [Candidatus Paceibacteria bacterium]
MALLPTIPTSFVPHVASSEPRNARVDFGGALGFVAYAILFIMIALSAGVFFYERILVSSEAGKQAQLATARQGISLETVTSFVHLRDRLKSSQTLLANHVAFSGFFGALKTLLPATVRFTALHIAIDASGSVLAQGTGVAKSFNALSAASGAFATDGRIKDVIFSKMVINKDNSVSFQFAATLDPKLTAFSPSASAPVGIPLTATSTTP